MHLLLDTVHDEFRKTHFDDGMLQSATVVPQSSSSLPFSKPLHNGADLFPRPRLPSTPLLEISWPRGAYWPRTVVRIGRNVRPRLDRIMISGCPSTSSGMWLPLLRAAPYASRVNIGFNSSTTKA